MREKVYYLGKGYSIIVTESIVSTENYSEMGHREADTIIDKEGKVGFVTLFGRKSRYLLSGKADGEMLK